MDTVKVDPTPEISEVDALAEAFANLKNALVKQVEANEQVRIARARVDVVQRPWFQRSYGSAENTSESSKGPKKPNVQIYEEIIRASGMPMYVTDIRDAAARSGVQWGGSKNPSKIQVQHALNASTRFMNVGNNTWWLANEPIPTQPEPSGDPDMRPAGAMAKLDGVINAMTILQEADMD